MRIGVLTSGGDCPGLNAVIRSVVHRAVVDHGDEVIGFHDGWKGLLECDYRKLDLDAVISLEADLRSARQNAEGLRARQKESGREIAGLEGEAKEKAISAVADLAGQVKEAAGEVDRLESEFDLAILEVPNLVAPDAAEGFGEEDSMEIKRVGSAATEGSDHASLGEMLGIGPVEKWSRPEVPAGTELGEIRPLFAKLEDDALADE